jgi:hypothetical protein
MTSQPNQPKSDEADREKETTPGGIAEALEERAQETGATTGPAASDPESPGATIDDPEPSEPNEPA